MTQQTNPQTTRSPFSVVLLDVTERLALTDEHLSKIFGQESGAVSKKSIEAGTFDFSEVNIKKTIELIRIADVLRSTFGAHSSPDAEVRRWLREFPIGKDNDETGMDFILSGDLNRIENVAYVTQIWLFARPEPAAQ